MADKIRRLEGLTDDEKSALLGLLHSHKKYGLVWEDEPETAEEEMKLKLPVLTEVKEKAIPQGKADNGYPNHILIEGDNLHALTVLSYTHANSIDVIYIDPPYNTGNKDFMYNDKYKYVDSDDDFKHSKWLSFMQRRLIIAKKILKDTGYIFISINNMECAPLRLLCDEIFGDRNFIGQLTWESTTQPINAGSAKYQLQQKVEYILCYCKRVETKSTFKLDEDDSNLKYPHNGKFGKCRFEIIEKSDAGSYKRDTMKFSILGQYPREGKRWQIGIDTARALEQEGKVEIVDGIVKRAVYPEDEVDKRKFVPFWSHLTAKEVGTALNGKDELNGILGFASGFDTVKPVKLIKSLLSHFDDNIKVLDFFAGSGTTLHAIMSLNSEDSGSRIGIIVQDNEGKAEICKKITYPRLYNVINGYKKDGEHVDGLTHNNLRYYKTDFVPRESTVKNMRALVDAATDMLCVKEDMYNEVAGFGAIEKLPTFAVRHFTNGKGGDMLVIYDETVIPEIVDVLYDMEVSKPVKIYVFSPNRNPYSDEFEDVEEKVELCALPAAIYDAYREVVPPVGDVALKVTEEGKEDAQ